MIGCLDHVALSVRDLERSIAFYCDVMGLKVARILECGPEMELGKVVGMPGCTARIAHLESGQTMLELFEYENPKGRAIPEDRRQADQGFTHIGFASTDARGDYLKLKELGVKFFSEPIEFRPGVWLFYFCGPDGEVCEVRQT